jgi:uncharacterized membrane protein AbrB (regulator of aidB expression)
MVGLFSLAVMTGNQVSYRLDSRLAWMFLFFMFALTFICFPPAAYGMSDAPPPRTQILPTYFFLAGLVALGVLCGNSLEKQKKSLTISTAIAVIAIVFAASIHSIHLYQSRGEFIRYARAWDQTEASILAARQNGATQVVIPIIPNWAQLNTPNDNPKFWVNICLSTYYDIQILAKPNVSSQ